MKMINYVSGAVQQVPMVVNADGTALQLVSQAYLNTRVLMFHDCHHHTSFECI